MTQPPDITNLKAKGAVGAALYCNVCHHSATISWEKLALPDETLFTGVRELRFVCSACGGRRVHVMPDWSGMRTPS